jgi:8-oxo-dGTP pyrophosphatase MutT (NUDIX family)
VLDLTEEDIRDRLKWAHENDSGDPYLEYPPLLKQSKGKSKPAAVLIPLLRADSAWQILFTRRRDDLPEHSGQVAFPGGRTDPGDRSPEATALREAWEEIGLKPVDVQILGRLRNYLTITNYIITPIVGVIPWPYDLKLETKEVSRAFTIPLTWLMDPLNHEEHPRLLPEPNPPVKVIYFKYYDGELLWGASARLTLTLMRVLTNAESSTTNAASRD